MLVFNGMLAAIFLVLLPLSEMSAASNSSSGGASPTSTLVTVLAGGTHNYSCFRVPTLLQTQEGTLLLAAEARRTNCGDQAPKDIVLTRSLDQGATWSPLERVVGTQTGNLTFRNPYLVEARAHGAQILLTYVNSTLADPWVSLQRISNDGGASWGPEEVVRLHPLQDFQESLYSSGEQKLQAQRCARESESKQKKEEKE